MNIERLKLFYQNNIIL